MPRSISQQESSIHDGDDISRMSDDDFDGSTLGLSTLKTKTTATSSSMSNQPRSFLITCSDCSNNTPKLDTTLFTASGFPKSATVRSMAGQYEIAPTTNQLHFHVYVNFTRSVLWKTMVEYMERLMGVRCQVLPVKRGTEYTTWQYVTKEESRSMEHNNLSFQLNPPKPKASKSSGVKRGSTSSTANNKAPKVKGFDQLYDYLKTKHHLEWTEVFDEASDDIRKLMIKLPNFKREWQTIRGISFPQNQIESVTILYGAAGVGKTTTATNMFPDLSYYIKDTTTGAWYDGLSRKDQVLIIEEMDGRDINMGTFLQLTDIGKEAPLVQVKHGSIKGNWKHVIITSNKHPMLWYEGTFRREHQRWRAFARRINKCVYYPPHKADGNVNFYGEGEVEFVEENDLLELVPDEHGIVNARAKTNIMDINGVERFSGDPAWDGHARRSKDNRGFI